MRDRDRGVLRDAGAGQPPVPPAVLAVLCRGIELPLAHGTLLVQGTGILDGCCAMHGRASRPCHPARLGGPLGASTGLLQD